MNCHAARNATAPSASVVARCAISALAVVAFTTDRGCTERPGVRRSKCVVIKGISSTRLGSLVQGVAPGPGHIGEHAAQAMAGTVDARHHGPGGCVGEFGDL